MAGTDQIAAHLDRAWDLLGRGDVEGALASAQRAVEMAPDEAEGYFLLGTIEARAGRTDDALGHFKDATDLDDGYVDAFLAAAELRMHPLGQTDACLELCDEVLSFVEDPRDVADATLLKFDAHLAAGERAAAAHALESLPEEEMDDPHVHHRIGVALYEVERSEEAARHLERAVALDPDLADAHYFLGLCRSELGDAQGCVAHWLRARELDERETARRTALSADEMSVLARRVLEALPAALRRRFAAAPLIVQAHPPAELVAEGTDPRAACYFASIAVETAAVETGAVESGATDGGDGAAGAARAANGAEAEARSGARAEIEGDVEAAPQLTAIFVYLGNVLRAAGDEGDVDASLRAAVAHEASHFFGIDDDEMQRLGLGGLHHH
ncbi:MAG TPA: tetratricopeptide repeat protein [Myxococcota bacterium]|jgi:tetratricopeptide (TPR) repeat protein|nr:tetratricopeptide repeat protein [Myxococcota bacterium]